MNVLKVAPILAFLSMCFAESHSSEDGSDTRYILYDVNPGEGFNLRRDVFMRMAVLVKKLNEMYPQKFVLVLPPWGRIWHWQSQELGYQVKIPWRTFFDVESINRFVPVIELEQFLREHGPVIDSVIYMQNYAEGWKDGKFEEKFDYRDCIDPPRYRKEDGSELYEGWFWEYSEMRTKEFKCLSVQGHTATIREHVAKKGVKALMLDRGEQVMHDHFGDGNYWGVRRSMRFSEELIGIANQFRQSKLDSTDEKDLTVRSKKWEDFKPERGRAKGWNGICVHLRRNDYVHSRKNQIPSIKGAAEQIRRKLKDMKLKTVFVSTDAPKKEFQQFKDSLGSDYEAVKFVPEPDVLKKYKDGGVAVIDQIICSHAKHFVGSAESTFTFRIQEEREIMGFSVEDTFGMLCPEGKFDCEKGSIWKIAYPAEEKKPGKHEEL